MEFLAEDLGGSVFLGKKEEDKVIIKESVEGYKEMRIAARLGVKLPLLAGALDKMFLADEINNNNIDSILDNIKLPKFMEHTITDRNLLVTEIKKVRNQGYAIDDEEYLRGVRAIATPIFL